MAKDISPFTSCKSVFCTWRFDRLWSLRLSRNQFQVRWTIVVLEQASFVDVGPQPGHRSDAHRVAGAETNNVYRGLIVLWLGIQVPQPVYLKSLQSLSFQPLRILSVPSACFGPKPVAQR